MRIHIFGITCSVLVMFVCVYIVCMIIVTRSITVMFPGVENVLADCNRKWTEGVWCGMVWCSSVQCTIVV